MTKIIFFVLLALVVVLWFKFKAGQRPTPPAKSGDRPVEDMVRCQVCGVNLPRSEAILSQGRFYCCDEHRLRG